MKLTLTLAVTTALLFLNSAIAPAQDTDSDDDFQPLIGEDLADWRTDPEERDDHWQLIDETIVGENEDERGSILWTQNEYTNFELILEYKTEDEDYDSGIFLRGTSHQVQIGISRSLERDMTGCIYAPSDQQGGYPAQTDKVEEFHNLGEWNTLRIIVQDKRIQTFLNDEPFVDYEGITIPESGPIGLQLHQGVHMKMIFRNIRVRELE